MSVDFASLDEQIAEEIKIVPPDQLDEFRHIRIPYRTGYYFASDKITNNPLYIIAQQEKQVVFYDPAEEEFGMGLQEVGNNEIIEISYFHDLRCVLREFFKR